MGFKAPDYNSILYEIGKIGTELYSPYNDGYIQWEAKKNLYFIKFKIDELIKDAPTFADEDKFLKEYNQEKMWKELKK